jgi:hypothetical protein
MNVIEDNVIWLSLTAHIATVEQVAGRPILGGTRDGSRYFGSRYVEASYVERGRMVKLSHYCGITLREDAPPGMDRSSYTERLKETATRLQETLSAVNAALGRYPHLEVFTGGSLHLHNPGEVWTAKPGDEIEAPPETTCGVCGCVLHLSNEYWRDAAGKFEVWVDNGVDYQRRPKKALDHVHAPAVLS